MKLICVPFAGGTAAAFEELGRELEDVCMTEGVEYAGHGRRRKEHYYSSFREMAEDCAVQVNRLTADGEPYLLFGYSMGAIVCYEMLAERMTDSLPQGLVLACHEAPDAAWDAKKYHALTDEELFLKMQEMGGFPGCGTEMLNNRFFRKLHFEPLRADYNLLGQYQSRNTQISDENLPCLLIYSPADIPRKKIERWHMFVNRGAEVIPVGNNHFLIRDETKHIAALIRQMITEKSL